jgi:lipoprotein-anchoring transpeptidase ErfK/SrfK
MGRPAHSRPLVRGSPSANGPADPHCVARSLLAFVSLVCISAAAAALAPTTAVGRVVLDRPAAPTGWVQVPAARRAPPAHVIAEVRAGHALALRSRPFGPVLARVGAKTPFGSPRALSVVAKRHGRWLGVTEAGVGNNRVVWVDAKSSGLRYARTRLDLHVDLSARTLVVRRNGKVVRRLGIGVGRAGSTTPTGTFAVTDKLNGAAYSAAYGCCILALSATQPNLPAGWSGGNRIAIHGTLSSSDFGRAVSAGCVHASDSDLHYLMRTVPLGTPVVIRP